MNTRQIEIIIGVDVPLAQVIAVWKIWVRAPSVLSVPGVRAELLVASVLPLSCHIIPVDDALAMERQTGMN